MSDSALYKTLKVVGKVLPGLAPEQTVSGAWIHVNSSGTTSIADHDKLVKVALERFAEMREPTTPAGKNAPQR